VDGSAFISGQVLTLTASGFTDLGVTALTMAANKTATASTDSSSPTATASLISTTITQPATAAVGTGSTMVFKALATGVATGTLGELWTIQGIEGTAGATPYVSLFDGSNRKVVVAYDYTSPTTASTPTATNVCAAFNAHASAGATFSCTVASGNATLTAAFAATYLTGGEEVSIIEVDWSDIMNPGQVLEFDSWDAIGDYDVNADGSALVDADEAVTEVVRLVNCSPTVGGQTYSVAVCGNASGANSFITGVMRFRYTSDVYTERLTAGTSTLSISASSAADMAGNYATTSAAYVITIS